MASATIHLAIAKNILDRNSTLNKYDVLKGTLYPDTVSNKNVSHYADLEKRGKDNISHLQGKVNLYSFLTDHKSLTDFELGWFIHLMTDYLFFDECFTKEYLLTHSYDEFRRDLYFAYDSLNDYLTKKYNISLEDYTVYQSEFHPGISYQENIFGKDLIDSFIDRVSSIDIEPYIKKIILNKQNIKP